MKMKFILGALVFFTVITGCKNDKSVDSLEVVEQEIVDNDFKVVIDFTAKKDDDFALYYTVDGTINFYGTEPVWQGFKGSDSPQQLTFIIPDEIKPTQIRLDFGMKQDQPDIIMNSFKMMYKGKTFEAKESQIFNYFMADANQCTVDIPTRVIKAVVKDGKRLTPSIYPGGDALAKEIEKLVK